MRVAPIITLSADEQKTLEKLARSNTASVRLDRTQPGLPMKKRPGSDHDA